MAYEEREKKDESDGLYDKLKQIEPSRDVNLATESKVDEELGGGDGFGGGGASGIMSNRKLSDFQSASQMLNPDMGKDLNHILFSRIFPDVYNPFQRMLVKDMILRSNEDESVVQIIAKTNTALSKAIDGEGIIDMLTLYGAQREAKMEEDRNRLQ